MERVLVLKGKKQMRPTVSAWKNNKERWMADGWREASKEELLKAEGVKEEAPKPKRKKKELESEDPKKEGSNEVQKIDKKTEE